MTQKEVNDRYFEWLIDIVCDRSTKRNYCSLLKYLHDTPFRYSIDMDGNRAEDGIDLRYRFGSVEHIPESIISNYLDDRDCSVLEMMVALSLRVEEHITDNPDIGNRTGEWFWTMIGNLDLEGMHEDNYNPDIVQCNVDAFLDRHYAPDGSCGGLFVVKRKNVDLTTVEIWYQMMWYISETVSQ